MVMIITLYYNLRERELILRQYRHNELLSRVYHGYEAVHRCVHEPFSLSQPDALLNAARYVLALTEDDSPPGVSKLYPLLFVFRNKLPYKFSLSPLYLSVTPSGIKR
jgi:hypothetical protein